MYKSGDLTMQYPAEYTLATYPQDPGANLNKLATLQRLEDIKLEIFQGDFSWSPSVYPDEVDSSYTGPDLKFEVLTVGEGDDLYSVALYYPKQNEQAKAELHAIVQTMRRPPARHQ